MVVPLWLLIILAILAAGCLYVIAAFAYWAWEIWRMR